MEWIVQPGAIESVYREVYPTFDQVKQEYETSLIAPVVNNEMNVIKKREYEAIEMVCSIHENENLRRVYTKDHDYFLICPLCEMSRRKNKSVSPLG
jgi:hypothetical protein